MSPAELASPPRRSAGAPSVGQGEERLLCGWGRTAPTRARVLRPRTAEEVAQALAASPATRGGAIARGAARSYGDAAQNGGGAVIDATALRGGTELLWEDPTGGGADAPGSDAGPTGSSPAPVAPAALVRVGAGVTFAPLLAWLAARGLTLPVVPGTRHLTVGGAIAGDVHGKNHPHEGSFARHVESFTLCTPAEGPLLVTAEHHPELFDATLGGMGLTGVVVEATLRLAPLRNAHAVADVDRLDTLDRALAAIAGEQPHRYTIAWVDLLGEGAAFGRAVLTRSDEGPATAPATRTPFSTRRPLTVPRGFPGGVLRPAVVRAFNALHWHTAPRHARGRTLSMSAQLFPLDALGEWSRLYGPAGMVQYQFAVPRGEEETLLRVVHLLRARRAPMYLAVLKRFGPGGRACEKGGPLSFPLEGLTLAIDLPAGAPGVYRALDDADELVAGAGGRVYLAKDARLRPATLAAMYPELERFRELRGRVDPDGVLRSDMGRRLGLCG
jgi:decaprenylphospho-beta-D-ribofuranose 2-oxidase